LDAKSCYDRISPPIAALSVKRQGAPQSFNEIMFRTIDEMKHYIRTAYGDSELTYGKGNERFHGILQGNGAGPAIWALVSTPVLDRLRHKEFGINIMSHGSGKITKIPAFAFVDDTDLVHEIGDEHTAMEDTQQALNTWEEGLQTTGGALVPEKCSVYTMIHQWQNDHWMYITSDKIPGEVNMTLSNGERMAVHHREPSETVKSLGIMFSPDGQMKDETEYLQQKGRVWAEKVRQSRMTREEVWYSLNTMIWKTIEYPLLATSMTKEQINLVVKPILEVGLPRSGICRNMARAIVFSEVTHQGLGMKHPYLTQGLRKLNAVFDEASSMTNDLIEHAWESCQVVCGLGENFLIEPFHPIGAMLERCWMTTLWEFLDEYQIKLDCPSTTNFRFEGDCFLMSKTMGLHARDLQVFNHCRIYLKVELLSDILTACGARVREKVWCGESGSRDEANTKWPNQPRPSQRGWKL
jgi:Reverse transcriptase (RNA-dependent DNA polymerase)